MAAERFVQATSTGLQSKQAKDSSAGAGDAGALVALDSAGKIDLSMMPTGVGADTATIVCSENLAAGDLVNLWDDSGTIKVRKADASNGRRADGFVLSAYTTAQSALVYFEGSVTGLSSLTLGSTYYLSDSTPGGLTTTAPTSGAGKIQQEVGRCRLASALVFEPQAPIVLTA